MQLLSTCNTFGIYCPVIFSDVNEISCGKTKTKTFLKTKIKMIRPQLPKEVERFTLLTLVSH